MKKILFLSLLTLLLAAIFANPADAQSRGKKKKSSKTDQYFDESGFVNKLWYGGNFNLGFAGSGETNQFVFGLSPMVGYKIVGDIISAGPRIGFTYNFIKGRGIDNQIYKTAPVSYSFGAFARVKPIQNFFAHFEYENENTKGIEVDQFGRLFVVNGKVSTYKETRDNLYIGLGYSSGGLWAYEIMLLYNANDPGQGIDLPFSFRFGLTYKF